MRKRLIASRVAIGLAIWVLTCGAISGASSVAFAAGSADLQAIDIKQFGSWEAGLHENNRSKRRFCAAASRSKNGTIFRINVYLDTNDTFLEFFNEKWSYRSGKMRCSLEFDRSAGVELHGESRGNDFTYDLLEVRQTQALLGMIAMHKSFRLINSNGATIDLFSLNGAREAVRAYSDCQTSR